MKVRHHSLRALAIVIVLAISTSRPSAGTNATTTPTVVAWGDNSGGQLGYENSTTSLRPAQVLGLGAGSGVVAIASGYAHTVALKANGALLAWGENDVGQLGDGTTVTHRLSPVPVAGLNGSKVAAIATGFEHTLALKSDGTVLAWGLNANGQLGDGTTINRATPLPVTGLGPGSGVIAVTASGGGGTHSLALKSDGTLWAWGSNQSGQLGDGTQTQRTAPVQVSGISGVIAAAAGANRSFALKSDGTVWGWGGNNNGAVGDGTQLNRSTPVQVVGLSQIVKIAIGRNSGIALKSDGSVFVWGQNASNQLGLGDGAPAQLTAAQMPTFGPGSGVVGIYENNIFGFALKSDGTVLGWGFNVNGQVGDGTTLNRSAPVQVSGFGPGSGVIAVSPGDGHAAALKSDGTVLAWGFNSGALGNGAFDGTLTPRTLSALGAVRAISGGSAHSLAVDFDGAVFAWGTNANGQLGNGSVTNSNSPVPVTGLGAGSGAVAVAAGNNYSLALKSDGAVSTWGANNVGQLGDGTTAQKTNPVGVVGLSSGSGTIAISAGDSHNLALKADGTVIAWGAGALGRLGNGGTTNASTPVQVSGLGSGSGVVAIAAGTSHSLALKADGTVLAWGGNGLGQLGDGSTTTRSTPVQVAGLGAGSGVVAIAAGLAHSMAMKANGTVLAWGDNSAGQVGDGTTTQRVTPTPVATLGPDSGIVSIATSSTASHCLALKADGVVLAWGYNYAGQIGDGSFENRLSPVVVDIQQRGAVKAIAAGRLHSLAIIDDRASNGATSFSVFPGGTSSLTTAGTTSFTTLGYTRVQSDNDTAGPAAMAILSYRQSGVLTSETVIPALPPISNGRFYHEANGPLRTAIAIANPNSTEARITFYFSHASGDTAAGTLTIAGDSQVAKFLDEAPFNSPSTFQGTFTFSSTQPVGVAAFRIFGNERSDSLMSVLPIADPNAPATVPPVLPHFAAGAGWTTHVLLVNPTDTDLRGAMQLRKPDGSAANVNSGGLSSDTFSYSIARRSSQRLSFTGTALASIVGSIRIAPEGNGVAPSATAILSYKPNAVTLTETTLSGIRGPALRMYVRTNPVESALVLANSGSTTATVTLQPQWSDGSVLGVTAKTIDLPPAGQTAGFISELLPSLPPLFEGSVRITTTSPNVVVGGLRTRYNERGEFLISSTMPVSEFMPIASETIIPQFADSRGYSTQLVFLDNSGSGATGGLRLVSQNGTNLNLLLR